MKKIVLLFIIICASNLYCMKRPAGEHYVESDYGSELKPEIWGQLPSDVKALIMVTLAQSGNNLDEAIDNIKKVSVLNKTFNQIINAEYGVDNLQGFNQLVHILADKFGMTTKEVAEKFGTPIAKQYIQLGYQLICGIKNHHPIGHLNVFIKNGADVNYSTPLIHDFNQGGYGLPRLPSEETPMLSAMKYSNFKAIVLLLDSGVKLESDEYYDKNNYWPIPSAFTGEAMKRFIDEERVKRQKKE